MAIADEIFVMQPCHVHDVHTLYRAIDDAKMGRGCKVTLTYPDGKTFWYIVWGKEVRRVAQGLLSMADWVDEGMN